MRSNKPPVRTRSRTKKLAEWRETGRKELGLYASGPVSGPGWSNLGYFNIIYEVSEVRDAGVLSEHRVRIEHGPPCRRYGEGYEAFVALYRQYARHARVHEKTHVLKYQQCFTKHEVEHPEPAPKARRTRSAR